MARFLACTSPARGHLYPITPTLLELGRRGHDVHMCTVSSEVSALAASGVHAAGIEPAIEAIELNDWQSTEPSEGIARIFGAFAQRADYEIADLRRAIADTRPDCLIIDITTAGAAAVAEASGLRAGRGQRHTCRGRPCRARLRGAVSHRGAVRAARAELSRVVPAGRSGSLGAEFRSGALARRGGEPARPGHGVEREAGRRRPHPDRDRGARRHRPRGRHLHGGPRAG